MAEPVSLEEAKKRLDTTRDDQDNMIAGMIVAAREWIENFTGLILAPRKVVQGFRSFNGLRDIGIWPIADDAVATVSFIDSDGDDIVVPARLLNGMRPARVYPAPGGAWPSSTTDQIIVAVDAGYASPADVPASLRAAILLMVGDLYANREPGVTGLSYAPTDTLMNLCRPYRLQVIG